MARREKVGEDKYLADKYKLSQEDIDKLSPENREALMKVAGLASGSDGNAAWGTSRESGWDKFVGGFTDSISNVANFYDGQAVSSDTMYVGPDGKVHPRTCFVAGTLVHTRDGLKAIEEIKVGDVVISKSDTTGEVSYRKVANTFVRQTDAIYKVSFADGTTLETTWNHPFRVLKSDVKGQNFALENTVWTQAKDLVEGDVAFTANGATLNIVSISIDNRDETVYNFEVEEFHTYFVGEVGVWVHNDEVRFYESITPDPTGYTTLILQKERRLTEKVTEGCKGSECQKRLDEFVKARTNAISGGELKPNATEAERLGHTVGVTDRDGAIDGSIAIVTEGIGGIIPFARIGRFLLETRPGKYLLNLITKNGSGLEKARRLGQEGEEIAGITKPKERIPSKTQTANYRVPDELLHDEKILREIKNVSNLSYTKQLKDFNLWAKDNGYKFILEVRPGAKLSGPLEAQIKQGNIILKELGK